MGACGFEMTGYGRTARNAYNGLVEDALYDSGHDPYNGTISTTEGFIVKHLDQKSFTKKAIRRFIDKALADDGSEKWGPCWCLELPKSFSRDTSRGVRAFLFVGWAAE